MSNDRTENKTGAFPQTKDVETDKDSNEHLETDQDLLEEESETLREIEELTIRTKELDDELHFAEADLKREKALLQGDIQEEKKLEEQLSNLTEKVEVLLTATEEMESTGLLDEDKVKQLLSKADEKWDEEIQSLRSEIEAKQKTLANLRKH